jgi:hypothetical protein
MIRNRLLSLTVLAIISITTFATTWDEPWKDKVIKEADSFVLAKIKSFDKYSVTIEIIKTLAGKELRGSIEITDFYHLNLQNSQEGRNIHFDFGGIKESYFFIKKNEKEKYCIATPTTGFDYVEGGKVNATYRHSYHQALVPIEIYEKTMTAIFNNYHYQPYDKKFINDYVKEFLSRKPAGIDTSESETFFGQHVALECIYHLRLKGFYQYIIPYLNDTSNLHNQVSAARALIAYNTSGCKQELLKVISDTTRRNFVQVICIWTLTAFNPKELKEKLIKIKETASGEPNGFGGDVMDPRVGTYFPTVKEALEKLIDTL